MDRETLNPYLRRMMSARRFTLLMIVWFLVLILLSPVSGLIGDGYWVFLIAMFMVVALFLAGIVLTWLNLFMAGWYEISAGYAFRHLVLSILLTPFFLFGIILIPLLVRSDLLKRREVAA